jgi:Zn-dependent hydrolases, including glyoxylases
MITTTKVLENVYVLRDSADCCANLVIGENKALLFDTGSGIDNMNEAVRTITALPLMVINSHGHFDHIGGDDQFDEVYLSELDFSIIEEYDIEILNQWMKDLTKETVQPFSVPPKEWKCIRRLEFDSFDLGHMWCKIIPLQGHTAGSIGIWIPSIRLLLSGDALTPVMCLNFQNHLSIQIQYETLVRIRNLEFDFYLTSHQDRLYTKQLVHRMISCIKNSDGKRFHFYQYPHPPYAKGWIYLDSLGEEPVALIVSEEERNSLL